MNELLTKERIAERVESRYAALKKSLIRPAVIIAVFCAVFIALTVYFKGRIVSVLITVSLFLILAVLFFIIIPSAAISKIKKGDFTVTEDVFTGRETIRSFKRIGEGFVYYVYMFRSGIRMSEPESGRTYVAFDITEPGDVHYIIKPNGALFRPVAVFSSKHYSYSENK